MRKLTLILIVFVVLFVVAGFDDIKAGSNSFAWQAYWQLNETSGNSFDDSIGKHDASCTLCPTPVSGQINNGQSFSGNDEINVPSDASFNWDQSDSYSVEYWVKAQPGTTCLSADEVMVGRGQNSGTAYWSLGCVGGSGKVSFKLSDNSTSVNLQSTKVITEGMWHHVAGSYDGLTNVTTLVVDGADVISTTHAFNAQFAPPTANINIGHLDGAKHFNGTLDEVAIYQGVLSQRAVSMHYYLARGYNNMCSTPVDMMPLGNSITRGEGSGPAGEEYNPAFNYGYRWYLYNSLTTTGYDFDFVGSRTDGVQSGFTFDYQNEGHSSYRADQILPNLIAGEQWLTNNPSDVILLHIGTNDAAGHQVSNYPIDIAEIEQILETIDTFNEDITVVVALIILKQGELPKYEAFNVLLAPMVEARIAQGDKLILVNQEDALDYNTDMFDPYHPNDSGYQKMAGVWYAALDSFLPWANCAGAAITSSPTITTKSGQLYTYSVVASGTPAPTFTLKQHPEGMTIDAITGALSWTPSVVDIGTHQVEIVATNDGGSATQSYTLLVPHLIYLPTIVK